MLTQLAPGLRALLVHIAALLGILLLYRLWSALAGTTPGIFVFALGEGLIAAGLGVLAGLRAWWLPINLLFAPALAIALTFDVHPLWYLLLFISVWLLNWNALGEQVPLYLSGNKTVSTVAQQLEPGKHFHFADFGCGLGGVLVKLARRYPQANFSGFETAPLPYLIAKLRSLRYRNLRVMRRSFWSCEWDQFDVVYCFLSPVPMPAIEQLAEKKLKPGALFISNSFALPTRRADRVVEVGDRRRTRLFLYRKA